MRLKYLFLSILLSLVFLSSLLLSVDSKYIPKNKNELLELVKNEKIKLNEIDTSKIVDMSYLFCRNAINSSCNNSAKERKDFSGIETWNVGNVENMAMMFYQVSDFNEPIGVWNVAKVKNMSAMFYMTDSFNQPLENWNVKKVRDMSYMFAFTKNFNQPLENWNVGRVENMKGMFHGASAFNQPLEKWDVSNVENMGWMFAHTTSFNQPLNSWKLNPDINIKDMFAKAKAFNQDLSSWEQNKLLEASIQTLSLFDRAFALIGVDESKATQLFLQSLNSKEEEKEKQQDSKLYLAYLYLNNPNGDKEEANRLANEYVDNLLKDCTKDNDSNFCLDYSKPSKFESVEDIFDVIYFAGKCYSYGMIPSHPSIFQYMGMYYGGNRDNFLGSFCGYVPPPYQIISISPIIEAKNYPKLLEFLEAKPYSYQGSMRFGFGANHRKNELIYSFFPKFDIHSSTKWNFSATEDPDYIYFGWFKMIINQYPDLLDAYNKCVKDAQEYYINVLKIKKPIALEYGKKAVELLLLQEILYYAI